MLTAAAHVAVEHGSHVPVIGPGIVFIIIALPIVGSWLATRGIGGDDDA